MNNSYSIKDSGYMLNSKKTDIRNFCINQTEYLGQFSLAMCTDTC